VAEDAEIAVADSLTLSGAVVTVAEADTADAPCFMRRPAELNADVAVIAEDDSRTRKADGEVAEVAEIAEPLMRTRKPDGLVVEVDAMVDAPLRTRKPAGEVADVTVTVRSPNLTRTQLTATEDVAGPKLVPSSRSAVEYAA